MSTFARFLRIVGVASIVVVTLAAMGRAAAEDDQSAAPTLAYAEHRESTPLNSTIMPPDSKIVPPGAEDGQAAASGQETPTSEPKPAPAAVSAKIEDFEWLAGRWVGTLQKSRAEEIWSKADAGLMMGMFRLVSNEGKTSVIEIMTLREVGDSVEMRLRHLSEELTTWEPIDQAGVLILTRKGEGEFEFASPKPGETRRGQPLRQTWQVAGDTLRFEVFAMRDGAEKKIIEGETKRVALDAKP